MTVIGIDPGKSGALVALALDQPYAWLHMPTKRIDGQRRIDAGAIAQWLRDLDCDRAAWRAQIEDTTGYRRDSALTAYGLGYASGVITGVLGTLGIPCTYVPTAGAKGWKTALALTFPRGDLTPHEERKEKARLYARDLWADLPEWMAATYAPDLRPDQKTSAARERGQALADAALIARHKGSA